MSTASSKKAGRSHWAITATLIVSEVIGGGVLALPGTFANLGWISGIASLLLLGYFSLYTGLLMARLHSLYPSIKSYGDLGAEFLGNRGRVVVSTFAYTMIFGFCVEFLVSMVIFINQAATSVQTPNLCFVTSAAVLSVIVLLLSQVKDLHGVGHLACWIAVPTLYGALALLFYQLFASPEHAAQRGTNMWPPFTTQKTIVAFMSIVQTYAGHCVFFELISNMQEPKDFWKAVISSQAVVTITYFVVALPVYVALGNGVASPFQLSLPASVAVGVADILMVAHVLISLILNHHVISKIVFGFMASSIAQMKGGVFVDEAFGSRSIGSKGWFAATVLVTGCAWLIANLVPFFSDIMALLSSLAAVNLTYGFPAAAALFQHQREVHCEKKQEVAAADGQESGKATDEHRSFESARVFMYPRLEVPFCWLLTAFSAIMMVYGTVNAVRDTIDNWALNSRHPFGC